MDRRSSALPRHIPEAQCSGGGERAALLATESRARAKSSNQTTTIPQLCELGESVNAGKNLRASPAPLEPSHERGPSPVLFGAASFRSRRDDGPVDMESSFVARQAKLPYNKMKK